MAQFVERQLCDREVFGSISGRVIQKTLKMVLAALSLELESELCKFNVTGRNILGRDILVWQHSKSEN